MPRRHPVLLCLLLPLMPVAQAHAHAPASSAAASLAPDASDPAPLVLRLDPLLAESSLAAAGSASMAVLPTDTEEWGGRMTASLAMAAGNRQTTALRVDVDVAKREAGGKTSVVAAISESQSGRGDRRQTTAGRWSGTVEHDRDLDHDSFAFARAGAAQDRVLDLRLRTQVSVGVGRRLLRNPDETLEVTLGVGRTASRYAERKTIGGQTDTRFASNVLVLGNEYTRQITRDVQLKQRLEGTLSIDGDRNQTLNFSTVLSVDMTRTLALTVSFTDVYARRVAVGQRRNDATLTTGLSLRLGP